MCKCYICGKKIKDKNYMCCHINTTDILIDEQYYWEHYYYPYYIPICYNCLKKINNKLIIVDIEEMDTLRNQFLKNIMCKKLYKEENKKRRK